MINPIIKVSLEHMIESIHTALMLKQEEVQNVVRTCMESSLAEYEFVKEIKRLVDQEVRNQLESAVKSAIHDLFWSDNYQDSIRKAVIDIINKK